MFYGDLDIGMVVEFTYDSGSTPGAKRVVYITDFCGFADKTVQGFDFTKSAMRNFSSASMRDITERQAKVVQRSQLPCGFDVGEVSTAFARDNNAVFVNDNVIVAVQLPLVENKVEVLVESEKDKYGSSWVQFVVMDGNRQVVRLDFTSYEDGEEPTYEWYDDEDDMDCPTQDGTLTLDKAIELLNRVKEAADADA